MKTKKNHIYTYTLLLHLYYIQNILQKYISLHNYIHLYIIYNYIYIQCSKTLKTLNGYYVIYTRIYKCHMFWWLYTFSMIKRKCHNVYCYYILSVLSYVDSLWAFPLSGDLTRLETLFCQRLCCLHFWCRKIPLCCFWCWRMFQLLGFFSLEIQNRYSGFLVWWLVGAHPCSDYAENV